jgi:hypothetical protein
MGGLDKTYIARTGLETNVGYESEVSTGFTIVEVAKVGDPGMELAAVGT